MGRSFSIKPVKLAHLFCDIMRSLMERIALYLEVFGFLLASVTIAILRFETVVKRADSIKTDIIRMHNKSNDCLQGLVTTRKRGKYTLNAIHRHVLFPITILRLCIQYFTVSIKRKYERWRFKKTYAFGVRDMKKEQTLKEVEEVKMLLSKYTALHNKTELLYNKRLMLIQEKITLFRESYLELWEESYLIVLVSFGVTLRSVQRLLTKPLIGDNAVSNLVIIFGTLMVFSGLVIELLQTYHIFNW